MSKAREIADLLDVGGDVLLDRLDNLPAGAAPDWNTLLNKPVLAPSATVDTTNADNITSGTMLVGRIGTGTNDATTYLRGDGTWTTNCTNFANCTVLTPNCGNCSDTDQGVLMFGSGGFGVGGNCNGGINGHTFTNRDGTEIGTTGNVVNVSTDPEDVRNLGFTSTNCWSACDCACNC